MLLLLPLKLLLHEIVLWAASEREMCLRGELRFDVLCGVVSVDALYPVVEGFRAASASTLFGSCSFTSARGFVGRCEASEDEPVFPALYSACHPVGGMGLQYGYG